MKKLILNIAILSGVLLLLNACVKDKFDGPDVGCVIETPTEGERITVQYLMDNYSGTIGDDVYLEAVVIADDQSGNFYKKIIIQDETNGIAVNIDRTSFYALFPIGRTVYVNLNGLFLDTYGELQGNSNGDRILNAEIDNYIKRGACFQDVKPDTVALSDLNASYVNKLVTILGVEFTNGANGITYADAISQSTVNLDLTDCNNTIVVRTSGFSKFAGDTVAFGNGAITGVFNIFGSTSQLLIRSPEDVNFTESRCDGSTGGGGGGGGGSAGALLYKDFDDNSLTSGGWTTFQESGTVNWNVGNFNSFYYGNISNFDFGTTSNSATVAWLISPSVDLSATTTPVLNFRNAYKYNGDPLELLVSTDYTSANPTSATWTNLTYTESPGNFTWVDSDDVLLSAYQTANVHIAFKYTGTNSDGANWEVDEIEIKEL